MLNDKLLMIIVLVGSSDNKFQTSMRAVYYTHGKSVQSCFSLSRI